MSRKFLGLDVRYDSVTAVLVTSSLRETQVENFLRVPVPDDATREDGLRSALAAVRSGMDVEHAFCVASIPAEELAFRNIRVPFKGERKIDQVLPFEIEPTVPFPLENLVIDFQTIPHAGHENQTDLIAAAASKSTIQSYLDIFASVGLDPQVISPGGCSTVACLNRFAAPPHDWIFVDSGREGDTLFFVTAGQIQLIRSFPSFQSGNGYTGLDAKIRQTLMALENLSATPPAPEKAYLAGQGLNGSGERLQNALEAALSLPVSHTDLIRHAKGKIKISSDQGWKSDEMDNALALAISQIEGKRHLNFRKGDFASKRNWAAYRSQLIRLGIFAMILLALLGVDVFLNAHTLNRKIDRIDREILTIFRSTFPDIQRVVDPVHQMKIAMDDLRKETFLPGDSNNRTLTINIIDEISKQIPGEIDVEFTRMVISQDDVLISGNTDTFNSVDDIQTHLEKNPLFQKVTINSTNKDQNENRVRFKMKVDL